MRSLDAALLRALRASRVYVPPTELAAQTGATRAAIATRIAELRGSGFEIDERPGLGYRLLAAPDRLIADDLSSRLGNCPLIREIVTFEEIDSTNDRAMQLGRAGIASGLAIFAERQRAGRGRFGRRWESASHLGIWCSLLLRPIFPVERWPRLTTWAAVALATAIEETFGLRPQIKWPNDLHIGSRKVAGILLETGTDSAQAGFVVVGFGINANHTNADFSPELLERATSLRLATGRTIDRAALAAAILRALDQRFASIDRRFSDLLAEATRRSLLLGNWVHFLSGERVLEGLAESLDGEGQLLLRTADGALHALSAGEVSALTRGFS